jgi:hypothetical protein
VDADQLRIPATQLIFRAWCEDWEKDNLESQDCVIETSFLKNYKDLVFLDPGLDSAFTVASQNCEYYHGRIGGWHLICETNAEDGEAEA